MTKSLLMAACSTITCTAPPSPPREAPVRDERAIRSELPGDMANAGARFLASLESAQTARAQFAFEDRERLDWHYIPRSRRGIALGELTDAQRHLAYGFLATALSRRGLLKATAIMALEDVLRIREQGKGAFARDAGAYFLSVFGEPSARGTWGWRLEGHHLSLNVTLVDGVPVAAPTFLGESPSDTHVLGREEELGFRLLDSLDAGERREAIHSSTAYEDILAGPASGADVIRADLPGIRASRLTPAQRALLDGLLDELLGSMPREVGERERMRIAEHGADAIVFSWAGATSPGQPHYFRLSGPTFLYELDNTQNGATHVHSVWHARDRSGGDFGIDLIHEHYEHEHRGSHR